MINNINKISIYARCLELILHLHLDWIKLLCYLQFLIRLLGSFILTGMLHKFQVPTNERAFEMRLTCACNFIKVLMNYLCKWWWIWEVYDAGNGTSWWLSYVATWSWRFSWEFLCMNIITIWPHVLLILGFLAK